MGPDIFSLAGGNAMEGIVCLAENGSQGGLRGGGGWVSGRGDHFDSLSSRHCTWTAIRSTRLLITLILKKQPRLVFIMQNTNYLEENGRGTEVLRVYNHYANVRNCRTYFIL